VRRRALVIPLVAILITTLDQISKFIVSSTLTLNEPWYPFSFLKPFFALTYIRNTGAAFGILQNQNLFFTIVAIIVITVILFYIRSTPQPDLLIALSLGLQLGGAAGNLIDRLHYGYVIDFLHLNFWAISNVSDVSISLGTVLLAYHLIFRMQPDAPVEHTAASPDAPIAPPADSTAKTENG
jgi:signal peptidase II